MNHFYYPELIYSNKIAYINMMRDPVDRFVSHYYYVRLPRRVKGLAEEYCLAHGNLTLEECIFGRHVFRGKCLGKFNVMAHYFCGMESNACHDKKDVLVKSSQDNLQSVYTVGIVEELQQSLRMLEIKFPNFFRGILSLDILPQNTNPKEAENSNVTNYIKKKHSIDYLLYDIARANLQTYMERCDGGMPERN